MIRHVHIDPVKFNKNVFALADMGAPQADQERARPLQYIQATLQPENITYIIFWVANEFRKLL